MSPSTSELLILHGLRLKGFVAAQDVAALWGLPVAEVEDFLQLGAQDGLTRFRDGARSGWSLTPEGRKENERLLAVELDGADLRPRVRRLYASFLVLNPKLLEACTRWQVSDLDAQVINDHQDRAYDASVIAGLHEIHSDALTICAELGRSLARFGRYGPKLAAAINRIDAGDTVWFTKPTIDSYHTVWFELHEDLLATLGLDRAAEYA